MPERPLAVSPAVGTWARQGRRDEVKCNLKQAWAKIKEAFRGLPHAIPALCVMTEHGVATIGLSHPFRARPAQPGLVIGCGAIDTGELTAAIRALVQVRVMRP